MRFQIPDLSEDVRSRYAAKASDLLTEPYPAILSLRSGSQHPDGSVSLRQYDGAALTWLVVRTLEDGEVFKTKIALAQPGVQWWLPTEANTVCGLTLRPPVPSFKSPSGKDAMITFSRDTSADRTQDPYRTILRDKDISHSVPDHQEYDILGYLSYVPLMRE
jgi:hypothetical protein